MISGKQHNQGAGFDGAGRREGRTSAHRTKPNAPREGCAPTTYSHTPTRSPSRRPPHRPAHRLHIDTRRQDFVESRRRLLRCSVDDRAAASDSTMPIALRVVLSRSRRTPRSTRRSSPADDVPLLRCDLVPPVVPSMTWRPTTCRIRPTGAIVDGTFSLVFVVFNSIGNLLEQSEWVQTFRNAARHLQPGGRFPDRAVDPEPAPGG
jgi:hypothetical protein